MTCPRCGNKNLQAVTETTSTGKDFSVAEAISRGSAEYQKKV